jgi:hypothetical protein
VEYEKVCKFCNEGMSRIVYGYPTESLLKVAKDNNWVLGGCMPSPLSFYCKLCNASWSEDLGFDIEN